MTEETGYIHLMNNSIKKVFRDALKISIENLPLAVFIVRTMRWQKKAARRRASWEKRGVHVPPFMIASIIQQCNLKCKGCYAQAHRRDKDTEMNSRRWMEIFNEAKELGISIILLAGGEPFLHPEILEMTKGRPETLFPVFSNGLLINATIICELKKQKNVIPVISIEGFEKETDERRGQGVYRQTQTILEKVQDKGIFFGVSITVTSENLAEVTSEVFIEKLIKTGCKLFFFVEYVPIEPGTEKLILSAGQKKELDELAQGFQSRFNGIFFTFPGDEKVYDGCLAAGRGFVHVSPEGNLEPCPFAPYSDANLKNLSLKEALQSDLLKTIRHSHQQLTEAKGGCALWENREWINSLLQK